MLSKTLFPILIVLCMIFLSGCTGTSPSSLYFTLSPIESGTDFKALKTVPTDIAIGIGPVSFPDEYDRASIVTQTGRNQISINEFHRWAGSLRQNFTRVMTQNLAILLGSEQVMARPWERYFKPDIRITVNIQKFTGQLGHQADLHATWMLIDEREKGEALVHRTNVSEPAEDESYDALVAAQSRALATFSKEVAMAIAEHHH